MKLPKSVALADPQRDHAPSLVHVQAHQQRNVSILTVTLFPFEQSTGIRTGPHFLLFPCSGD